MDRKGKPALLLCFPNTMLSQKHQCRYNNEPPVMHQHGLSMYGNYSGNNIISILTSRQGRVGIPWPILMSLLRQAEPATLIENVELVNITPILGTLQKHVEISWLRCFVNTNAKHTHQRATSVSPTWAVDEQIILWKQYYPNVGFTIGTYWHTLSNINDFISIAVRCCGV